MTPLPRPSSVFLWHKAHLLRLGESAGRIRLSPEGCSGSFVAIQTGPKSWAGLFMAHRVLTEIAVSISEHKKNPMATVSAGDGMAVAVLN